MILRLVAIVLSAALSAQAEQPNILFLMTDDQDTVLGGLKYMPILKKLLMDQGTTFSNFFVHTPVCCVSSRSSFLTGKYIHNIPMKNNSLEGNCWGDNWRKGAEQETFAVYAKNAGYQTAFSGKYLNAYRRAKIPPGWDRWMGLKGNSKFYDYTVYVSNEPGGNVRTDNHGSDYQTDYFPNLITNRTLQTIRDFSKKDAPFLIMASWPAPHGPITPAPEDVTKFPFLDAPRTPNWNSTEAQNAQKHWIMRELNSITKKQASNIDIQYKMRQRSLQSVDRHIRKLVSELSRIGKLNNTIIIYTSDNGFNLGQHRRTYDKRLPYEHDIRVPLVMRGPGVPKKTVIDRAVLNIDIAPTLIQLMTEGANINPPSMDGQSFEPLLRNQQAAWRADFLVSYHGEGYESSCGLFAKSCVVRNPADSWNNSYHCLRSFLGESNTANRKFRDSMYCQFDDDENFVEYYNLTADPWQLDNSNDELTEDEKTALASKLESLKQCQGRTCRDFSA